MYNPYKNSDTNKRYFTWDYYLKQTFGHKVGRVSLNAKFSCPNIDGTKGVGGCTFCFAGSSDSFLPLMEQYNHQLEVLENKWNTNKHFVYFQAFTNTHGPLELLKETVTPFINIENSVGIIIGTRADCIDEEKVQFLADVANKTELWVELGLQSSNDITADKINRCHTFKEFEDAVKLLRKHNIKIAVHLINSLPDETEQDMLNSVRDVCKLDIQAIKIHMLNIVNDTQMALQSDNIALMTKEEYVDVVVKQLEIIPEHIIIQRLTGDPDKERLIKPQWTTNKIDVLNSIDKAFVSNNTWQGKLVSKQLSPTVHYVHELLDRYSSKESIVIDATLGNGFDAEFLAPRNGMVIGYDINDTAIKRSTKRLEPYNNVMIKHKSHEHIADLNHNIDLVVFNTGYLPGSDKKQTTTSDSTIKAIDGSIAKLNKGGYLVIVLYKGHDDSCEYNNIITHLKDNKIYYQEVVVEKTTHAPSVVTIKK